MNRLETLTIILQVILISFFFYLVNSLFTEIREFTNRNYETLPIEITTKDITGEIQKDTFGVWYIYEKFYVSSTDLKVIYRYPDGKWARDYLKPNIIDIITYREL